MNLIRRNMQKYDKHIKAVQIFCIYKIIPYGSVYQLLFFIESQNNLGYKRPKD